MPSSAGLGFMWFNSNNFNLRSPSPITRGRLKALLVQACNRLDLAITNGPKPPKWYLFLVNQHTRDDSWGLNVTFFPWIRLKYWLLNIYRYNFFIFMFQICFHGTPTLNTYNTGCLAATVQHDLRSMDLWVPCLF